MKNIQKQGNQFSNKLGIKLVLLFFILSLNTLSAQNIMISNLNSPNEPSIMMNPKHPNVIVAGANLDGYYISLDTGRTWTSHRLASTYGVWGDPTIAVDTANNFYFFHLSNPDKQHGSWIDRIVCQKTSDNGQSWDNGSYTGLNGIKAQDKQWCAVDPRNNTMYLTWTQFDIYASYESQDSSIILFSKSTDEGTTWSDPLRINKVAGDCIDDDNTVEGAVPTVGPNGEVYVAWAGPSGLVFSKSLDQGKTWLKSEIVIDEIPGGWNYMISGLERANGLPIAVCDLSNGPNRGTIYINWSDQRNGENNTDIWLVKSTDGGETWTAPAKVNDDNSNRQQFLTWMTIDQTSGYLYFVFYDRRNYTSDSTDVYVAVSTDGGSTFINRKISKSAFVPNEAVFFGDYSNITAHNGIIRPIWTRSNFGQVSIWTDLTTLDKLLTKAEETPVQEEILSFENYPNPASNFAYVSYKLHSLSTVNLDIYDANGKVISNIVNNEGKVYGKYIERIDLVNLNIAPGIYFLQLKINNVVKTVKQIVVR